ncbi:hypothetical protein TTHERM_000571919 (macronuclear) [Tetrahymena thermophila SB210]|uniref:Uncharacterized protein n=1 Tax=Tetrahymena thermophila (strain SB210) TaxID=312017 RepID=W7XGY9_TETTS|nr:hypothetical protein TTHERM_000571919 [Tetrahymena thermophila SB210]EWS72274.1 hypothetical protein TTHERM_000571919 [Tetrahymena thermophila SB210]|eukprot:XP_012655214.1 hypothetical protein TTHERM_000571919 [Tetrahymena thermophila SB210]
MIFKNLIFCIKKLSLKQTFQSQVKGNNYLTIFVDWSIISDLLIYMMCKLISE